MAREEVLTLCQVRSALEQPAEGGEPAGVQLVVASRGSVPDEEEALVESLWP